ncbi:MAG: 3-deoxy-D-manno-octulosonic acid transferase [Chlamydiae bacterium]|nr:3-deoxy-D-manno-octulosonic acid transferase [Chlamydiota bacterium]
MFVLIYDLLLLFVGLLASSFLLWDYLFRKKYRNSLAARLGFGDIPQFSGEKVIWLHACSMGEMKVAKALATQIRKEHPEKKIVVSSITETGQAEAKKIIKEADGFFYLPLDFSCIISRIVKKVHPELLIIAESEFWYNLVRAVKEDGGRVALVNGKISEKSAKRFAKVSFFTKRLFSYFDVLCLQSEDYLPRFLTLPIDPKKIQVTGNLKFDAKIPHLQESEKLQLQKDLGIQKEDVVITIGSSHEGEEDLILSELAKVQKQIPQLKILLVPRHPHRFSKVAEFLAQMNLSFGTFSQKNAEGKRIVLVDAMGVLCKCYELSHIAIVAGSYTESVGGHNILEPLEFGVPVIFGPHMHSQPELTTMVLSKMAGFQSRYSELSDHVLQLLQDKKLYDNMSKSGLVIMQEVKGAAQKTWNIVSFS